MREREEFAGPNRKSFSIYLSQGSRNQGSGRRRERERERESRHYKRGEIRVVSHQESHIHTLSLSLPHVISGAGRCNGNEKRRRATNESAGFDP